MIEIILTVLKWIGMGIASVIGLVLLLFLRDQLDKLTAKMNNSIDNAGNPREVTIRDEHGSIVANQIISYSEYLDIKQRGPKRGYTASFREITGG